MQSAPYNLMHAASTRLLYWAAHLVLLAQVGLLALFWLLGALQMAAVSLAALGVCFLAIVLLRQGRTLPALLLLGMEVLMHSVLAVLLLGWASGFHYYLFAAVPVTMVSHLESWRSKLALCFGTILAYVALACWRAGAEPWFALDATVTMRLGLFNLTATLLAMGVLASLYSLQMQRAERQLHELATTDPLTGLMNRRSMSAQLARESARTQRRQEPLSFVVLDLDRFKTVNDRYGHLAGDMVLRRLGGLITEGVREVDLACRWGGEEFLIALPGTDAQAAGAVAERIRQGLQAQAIEIEPGLSLPVTASFGVACLRPAESVDGAIGRADKALYRAKAAGRNRVELADPPRSSPDQLP
ncbi:GGDEF domain-containing protein [Paucibacter soli]|uniref:GGDEF domain-containing protein n=1 Tax=Paucibacter soli TaxID=3133433 RepID=UPI0030A97F35